MTSVRISSDEHFAFVLQRLQHRFSMRACGTELTPDVDLLSQRLAKQRVCGQVAIPHDRVELAQPEPHGCLNALLTHVVHEGFEWLVYHESLFLVEWILCELKNHSATS